VRLVEFPRKVLPSVVFETLRCLFARVCCTATPPIDAPTREISGGWNEWWSAEHEAYYYVSVATGEISWQLPAYLNKLLRRCENSWADVCGVCDRVVGFRFGDWGEYWDVASQHVFYYNLLTRERSWEPPTVTYSAGDMIAAVSSHGLPIVFAVSLASISTVQLPGRG
jgi:WW domain